MPHSTLFLPQALKNGRRWHEIARGRVCLGLKRTEMISSTPGSGSSICHIHGRYAGVLFSGPLFKQLQKLLFFFFAQITVFVEIHSPCPQGAGVCVQEAPHLLCGAALTASKIRARRQAGKAQALNFIVVDEKQIWLVIGRARSSNKLTPPPRPPPFPARDADGLGR